MADKKQEEKTLPESTPFTIARGAGKKMISQDEALEAGKKKAQELGYTSVSMQNVDEKQYYFLAYTR